jgi:hypothetical protein
MDRATTASVLGTILGLAAGVIGMLLFSQPKVDMESEEQITAITRERDSVQTERDDARRALDDEIARRKRMEQANLDLADELERQAGSNGTDAEAAKEWKDRHDKLKTTTDETLRNKEARIGRLEGMLEENGIYEFLTDEEITERVTGLKATFETAFAGKDKKAAMEALWDLQKLGPKAYDDAIEVWKKMAEDFGLDPWGQGPGTMGMNMQDYVSLISKFGMLEYGLTDPDVDPSFRISSIYSLPWWANEDAGKRAKLAGDTLMRAEGYEAQAAVDALKDIADPSTARYLADYLTSNTDNADARKAAILALAQKNSDAGWAAIEDAAQSDPDAGVKEAAQSALNQKNVPIAGVLITQVLAEYQAALAGIKVGDILTHYNGDRIKTMAELTAAKAKVAEGQSVQIVVRRGEKDETLTLGSGMIGINGVNVAPKE